MDYYYIIDLTEAFCEDEEAADYIPQSFRLPVTPDNELELGRTIIAALEGASIGCEVYIGRYEGSRPDCSLGFNSDSYYLSQPEQAHDAFIIGFNVAKEIRKPSSQGKFFIAEDCECFVSSTNGIARLSVQFYEKQ